MEKMGQKRPRPIHFFAVMFGEVRFRVFAGPGRMDRDISLFQTVPGVLPRALPTPCPAPMPPQFIVPWTPSRIGQAIVAWLMTQTPPIPPLVLRPAVAAPAVVKNTHA